MTLLLAAMLAAQTTEPPSQPPEVRRPVVTARLVIPDEIAPAVVPYLHCLLVQQGIQVGGVKEVPPKVDDVEGCIKARNEAVEKSDQMLRRQGGRSSSERTKFIETTLVELEAFAKASAPPKAPDSQANVTD